MLSRERGSRQGAFRNRQRTLANPSTRASTHLDGKESGVTPCGMPRYSGTIAVSGGGCKSSEIAPPNCRRPVMHRLTSALCWLILGSGLVLAQPAEQAQKQLEGTWIATKAERDGKAADDVVGHRLSFTGNRFQIQSKDGKPLYAGTVRVDPSAKPAAIDFEHTEGALKGKVWKGIYALDGDTLTTCDNAPNLDKGRPAV